MERINAVIIDDERLARRRIRRLLVGEPDIDVLGESATPQQAIALLKERAPDLLFLDIQMPGLNGFEILEAIGENKIPAVIFVTAFEEYAVRAFEVHAVDYLLKPFDRRRFQCAIERAREHLRQLNGSGTSRQLVDLLQTLSPKAPSSGRLAVRNGGHVVLVKTDTIDWIEAADNYVCLHCGTETHVLRETMNSLETRLDRDRFLRIHRSTIVNVDRIKELQPWFRGDYTVLLHDGTQLTLSRTYREKLQTTALQGF